MPILSSLNEKISTRANCSNCHSLVKVARRATSFRCPVCQAINQRGSSAPTPPLSSFNSNNNYNAPPANGNGKKKALIIGISYKKTKYELQGCINDTKSIKKLLMNRFKFPESSILVLTDEETNMHKPTRQNIMKGMTWLMQGCQPGDSLVFHFSGHGSQQKHLKGEELDGYDELLWPLDFETNGMIIDDVINETIVNPLPTGVKLHAIIDACHSGTALDLPFLCRMDRTGKYVWEDHRPKTGTWKGTRGGEAIFFSGCDDHELSADSAAGSTAIPTGAMTFAFVQAIERGQGTLTYGSIITSMRSTINKTDNDRGQGGGAVKPNLSMLLNGGAKRIQEPQLSSCKPFDIYTKPFSL